MKKTALIIASFLFICVVSVAAYYDIVDIEANNNAFAQMNDFENEAFKNEINIENDNFTVVENDKLPIEEEIIQDVINIPNVVKKDGQIMIIMYHKFAKDDKNDEWTRSFSDFKKDLEKLYENNYRPISMTDYLTNNINIPEGTTPVVLTFDDGSAGQLSFERVDGELVIKENTAVKIMQDFNKEHPDFELKGTFYVSGTNFFGAQGTYGYRLSYLTDLGFEIGNLTKSYYALGRADSAQKVQEEVGGFVKFIDEYLPGYTVNSLSLPGGSRAKTYEEYMYKGEYEGYEYENKGVVSIYNSFPAKSPTDSEVNFKNIPRIKANDPEKGIDYWIQYFIDNPEEKYVK